MPPKKQSSNPNRKKLLKKLEKLQRLYVIRRDGSCALTHIDPLQNGCSDVLQADHLVTKKEGNMLTRFDIRNLNLLCSSHNMVKQWRTRCSRELAKIVDQRYGQGTTEYLDGIARMKTAHKLSIQDIEDKIKECEEYLNG